MKRLVTVLALSVVVSGCDETRCDVALDRMFEVIVTDCELVPGLQDQSGSFDCTDADAADLERQADCIEASDCYAISGSDPAGHRELSECIAGLSEPAIEEE